MLEQFPITKSVVSKVVSHPATPDILLLSAVVIGGIGLTRWGLRKIGVID